MTTKIHLIESNPEWREVFRREAGRLRAALGPEIVRIHHVGSTAVPGIKAKPIVDVTVESASYPPTAEVVERLAHLGYAAHGESNVPGRHWFTKGSPATVHLHWCPLDGEVARRQVRFVSRLTADAGLAREYEALKIALARKFPYDQDGYALGKTAFIEAVLARPGSADE